MVFALKEQNRIIGQLRREANANFMLLDDRSRRTQELVQKLVAKVGSCCSVEIEAIGMMTCTAQYNNLGGGAFLPTWTGPCLKCSSLLRSGPFFLSDKLPGLYPVQSNDDICRSYAATPGIGVRRWRGLQ